MFKDRSTVNSTGDKSKVLIPVDFSAKETLALKVGFELACRLNKEVMLIHASALAEPMMAPQFPDDFYGMDTENSEVEEVILEEEIQNMDDSAMNKLKNRIETLQRNNEIPEIKFETVISPGMPEEVISEYCTLSQPEVVVMATRGREKRREELIGSVTAEVIDHAVAPVLTVPEDYSFQGFKDIIRICAFCYFEESDYNAVSCLMSMFGNPKVKIFLFPASNKPKGQEERTQILKNLQQRLQESFPDSEFIQSGIDESLGLREAAEKLFMKESIQLILAPNRHRNALSRFFHPGLAHKILYEIDFPMLAIPV